MESLSINKLMLMNNYNDEKVSESYFKTEEKATKTKGETRKSETTKSTKIIKSRY